MSPAITLYIQISLRKLASGEMEIRYSQLLHPDQGDHGCSEMTFTEPANIAVYLYWLPDRPDAALRHKVLPGLERYINDILHGNPALRRITRNYPVRLEETLL